MKDLKILAMDPGIKNYAFSIVTDKPDVIYAGHLEYPICSLKYKDLAKDVEAYKNEVCNILTSCNLSFKDAIAIERYQSRGHKNIQIELINVMLGVIACMFTNQVILITPSTWKNAIKRKYATHDMYKIIDKKELSPHIADTIGIASYTMQKYYDKDILNRLLEVEWSWQI